MSKTLTVALLGFGTVGESIYHSIHDHQDRLARLLGKEVKVVAVLVKDVEKNRKIDRDVLVTTDFHEILGLPNVDVVMEAIVGAEPANEYLELAIKKGCHIVTANKQMFAKYGGELKKLSEIYAVNIGFEATTAGGIPIIQTLSQLIQVNRVTKLQGILNGTSNYILSEMRENGLTFQAALTTAGEKGYAEADPSADIEGTDAFCKLMILSELLYHEQPPWNEVEKKGIQEISSEWIFVANQLGYRIKHVAEIQKQEDSIRASVTPILIPPTHSLYNIEGVQNAVTISGSLVGDVTLTGPGAGGLATASAMLEDLIHIVSHQTFPLKLEEAYTVKSVEEPWLLAASTLDEVEAIKNNLSVIKIFSINDKYYFLVSHFDKSAYAFFSEIQAIRVLLPESGDETNLQKEKITVSN